MGAAFFDLDKTVIDRASVAAFGGPLRRGGLVNRRAVARAVVAQLVYLHLGADDQRLARVREAMLTLARGWDRDRVQEIVREALLQTVEPIIYAEALDLMAAHRRDGDRVYLVSAAPEEIVQPLAEMLGVDGSIGSRGEVDAEGRFTGRMAFDAHGEGKAQAMRDLAARAGIDLAASTAYSDSATDLPMLEAVGHPVAVNPDRTLARVARERGWETRQFTKPVRMRDRINRTTPTITMALVGGALLWWYGRRWRGAPARRHPGAGARGGRGQAVRSRLAATTPSATSTDSSSSFFMRTILPVRRHAVS